MIAHLIAAFLTPAGLLLALMNPAAITRGTDTEET